MKVGAAATPFVRSLESIPRAEGLKHFNFDSFDGLGDPEEHLNYFEKISNIYYYNDRTKCEQISNIYYYNDRTKCRFFASTLKGEPKNGSLESSPEVLTLRKTSEKAPWILGIKC